MAEITNELIHDLSSTWATQADLGTSTRSWSATKSDRLAWGEGSDGVGEFAS